MVRQADHDALGPVRDLSFRRSPEGPMQYAAADVSAAPPWMHRGAHSTSAGLIMRECSTPPQSAPSAWAFFYGIKLALYSNTKKRYYKKSIQVAIKLIPESR